MTTLEGRCLCGEVRFSAQGPTLFCAHCHCRFCRQAHGAAFVTWVGVKEEGFEITGGDESLEWFQSSKQSRRGFCSTCGSTMFFASTVAPGEMHIAMPVIADPIDRQPQAHVFFDQRVPWIHLGDELPRLDGRSEQLSKYSRIDSELDP